MKKIISYIFLAWGLITLVTSCSDMNDSFESYISGGERIYIGKVDSIMAFPGDGRIKFRFWASDPRAKTVGFYWFPYNDSLFVNITHTSAVDSFEVYIGGSAATNTIKEGNYTLKVITRDNNNHYSVPYEKIFNVYGDRFRSSLTNRVLKSSTYSATDASLSLTFSGPVNSNETGIEITYTGKDGLAKTITLADKEVTTPLKLLNVDKTKPVSYRTMFLPDPQAIDVFYSAVKTIVIP